MGPSWTPPGLATRGQRPDLAAKVPTRRRSWDLRPCRLGRPARDRAGEEGAHMPVEIPQNATTPLLEARSVRKVYRSAGGEVLALDDVDLRVERGEMVAVMGPSGSGKTTLLNCLSGLDEIDGGQVLVDGRDLFAMNDAERTRHRAHAMGFIFQAFNLIPVFTAVENVELPLLLRNTAPRLARERALAMLGRVGLSNRASHRPNELSGGEQQRVTIARALVGRPAIVWA